MSVQAQIAESRGALAITGAPITNTDTRLDLRRKVDTRIYNRRFGKALRFLFTLQQASSRHVTSDTLANIHLEQLNAIDIISFPQRWLTFWKKYSTPELSDWNLIETKITDFMSMLTDSEIKIVEIKHIAQEMLARCALGLLLLSIASLLASTFTERPSLLISCFIVWLAATGALGSAAFVYVNALSIETDPNVVVTSRTFVKLRLILGALFAMIISLPFHYPVFFKFEHSLKTLTNSSENAHQAVANMDVNSFLLILPFVLGFSTPLVLCILSRLVESVRALFGLGAATPQRSAEGQKSNKHDGTFRSPAHQ